MAELELLTESGDDALSLGEVEPMEGVGEGAPVRIVGRNKGGTTLHRLTVGVASEDGQVTRSVALAQDHDGRPGVWASPGESIVALDDQVGPQDTFTFWARAVYSPEDADGHHSFQFVVKAVSG